jgi:hypothetical protein
VQDLDRKKVVTVKKITSFVALCSFIMPMLAGCADGVGPAVREAKVPTPVSATERQRAINEMASQ